MHVVDQTKFIIGIVFAIIGLAMLVQSRGTRGFGQRKQAGALFLVAACLLVARGLGYLHL